MASKSLIVVAVALCCISSYLPVQGQEQDPSKHSHADHKFAVGDLLPRGLQSNISAGITTQDSQEYQHVAGYRSKGFYVDTYFHGVRAKMTVWKIQDVQGLSSSSAYIAALNTNNESSEMVVAGVHVYPQMYNNSDVRFYTYWRTTKEDIPVKGCYNTFCPGFVIANGSNLFPGQALASPPQYGEEAREITLRIKKDEITGDWSLYREDLGGPIGGTTLLGWWPKTLFKSLSDHADIIQWTGEVTYQSTETGPPMGNGHFPGEQGGRAASFYDCFGFDENGFVYSDLYKAYSFVDKLECYNVSPWYESGKPRYQHFYYGGPAGCSK